MSTNKDNNKDESKGTKLDLKKLMKAYVDSPLNKEHFRTGNTLKSSIAEVMHKWSGLHLKITELKIYHPELGVNCWKPSSWKEIEDNLGYEVSITMEGVGALRLRLVRRNGCWTGNTQGQEAMGPSGTGVLEFLLNALTTSLPCRLKRDIRVYKNLCQCQRERRVEGPSPLRGMSHENLANLLLERCKPLQLYLASSATYRIKLKNPQTLTIDLQCEGDGFGKYKWSCFIQMNDLEIKTASIEWKSGEWKPIIVLEVLEQGLSLLQDQLPSYIHNGLDIYEGISRSPVWKMR